MGRKLGKAQAPIRVAVTGRTGRAPAVRGARGARARNGRWPACGRPLDRRPLTRVGILATLTGLRLLRFVLRVIAFVVILDLIYLVVTAVQVWMTSRRYEPRAAGAIVVMGAAQYDGVPPPTWPPGSRGGDPLAPAPGHHIMVTGSKEPGDQFTEAEASERYLVAAGIPAGDILESGGSNTWESLSDGGPDPAGPG